jgi:hypothetical protein
MSARLNILQRRSRKSRIDLFSKRARAYRGLASTSYAFRQNSTKFTTNPVPSDSEPERALSQTAEIDQHSNSEDEDAYMTDAEDIADNDLRDDDLADIDDHHVTTNETDTDRNESANETEFIPSFRKGAKRNYHGPYGPYFPNYTAAAMSLFLLTAKLSRKNFNLLVRILTHPEFNKNHVPSSYKSAKRLLRGIPCLPIRLRNLPLTSNSSNSNRTRLAPTYTYSVEDILRRQFQTPSLRDAMYFGPGHKTSQPREFWHGELWRQSPLFGAREARKSDG